MIVAIKAARATVSGAVFLLLCVGFIPRELANRLIPLQKFLTNELEKRGAA